MHHDDYRAALALRHTQGMGPRSLKKLAGAYPSLTQAARDVRAWASRGLVSRRVADAFVSRAWTKPAQEEYEAAKSLGARAVLLGQDEYPPLLAHIPDPPLILYYRGRLGLALGPCVAIVGARRASDYGLQTTRGFAEQLSAAGVTVVSGLAMGIDREAHQGALEGPGSTVAVLGSGLGRISPAINADLAERVAAQGLLLSEFPPDTPAQSFTFPLRNRIISGLSSAVLVTEAAAKSGALITARHALEQGRDVFALPGDVSRPTFAGCHALLTQGAGLAASPQIVLEALGGQVPPNWQNARPAELESPREDRERNLLIQPASPAGMPEWSTKIGPDTTDGDGAESSEDDVGPDEQRLLRLLALTPKTHIDELGRAANLDGSTVSRLLLSLELQGRVKKWPGMYYSRK